MTTLPWPAGARGPASQSRTISTENRFVLEIQGEQLRAGKRQPALRASEGRFAPESGRKPPRGPWRLVAFECTGGWATKRFAPRPFARAGPSRLSEPATPGPVFLGGEAGQSVRDHTFSLPQICRSETTRCHGREKGAGVRTCYPCRESPEVKRHSHETLCFPFACRVYSGRSLRTNSWHEVLLLSRGNDPCGRGGGVSAGGTGAAERPACALAASSLLARLARRDGRKEAGQTRVCRRPSAATQQPGAKRNQHGPPWMWVPST